MTHFFADDGQKIHVHVSGEGPPLVLLHGWTASHMEWSPFMDALTQRHRVYRWDARGHGGHRVNHPEHTTLARMARDLENLRTHFELSAFSAVGHSMGALTLWHYLHQEGQDALDKLCLIDQSPKLLTDADWPHGIYGDFDQQANHALIEKLEKDFAEGVLQLTALGLNARAREKYLANHPGWVRARQALRQNDPAPLIACWKSVSAADYRHVLADIRCPTLLIFGGESNFYPRSTADFVANQIQQAVLSIYEGTDHSPHLWQRERFAQELLAFLNT